MNQSNPDEITIQIEPPIAIAKEAPDQVSFATLKNIIVPQKREVYSWTLFIFHYALYALLVFILLGLWGGGFRWTEIVSSIVNTNILPLTLALYCYEPFKILTAMAITPKYPTLESTEQLTTQLISDNKDLAIIIPCHKSEEVILETIKSCLKHVKERQIFIMDNDKGLVPLDKTAELIHQFYPKINYFFIPKTGNKTIALYYGAQFAKAKFKYSLIIDDDVQLSPNFQFNRSFFDSDPNVKGLVYPLRAISEYQPGTNLTRLITSWQDLEYQLADLDMNCLDVFENAVPRPHGAGSLWRISAMIEVLLQHNTVFHGEDAMMGNILQHMRDNGQHVLKLDRQNYISTYVPVTYFGPAEKGNLWFQRVRSWSVTQFTNFWELNLKPLLTVWDRPGKGNLSLLMIKENQLYNLYTQAVHVLRFPLMLFAGKNPRYWLLLVSSIVVQGLTALSFNYLKLPSNLRNELFTAVSFPLYKGIDAMMGTFAFLRAIFIELPTAKPYTNIQKMLNRHQLPLPNDIKNSSSPVSMSPKSPETKLPFELMELYVVLLNNEVLLALLICQSGVICPSEYVDCDLYKIYKTCISVIPCADGTMQPEDVTPTYRIKHGLFSSSIQDAFEFSGNKHQLLL